MDKLVYVLIFIIVVLLAIVLWYRNSGATLAILNRAIPAMAFDVAPGSDPAMRKIIDTLPMVSVPKDAAYRGVVGAAHVYAGDTLYKMYPLCCDMCRARAVYWMRRHASATEAGVAVPTVVGVASERPDGCFSQRHFSDDCDPVRRYIVHRYELSAPLTCAWAGEHRAALERLENCPYSTVLENCAVLGDDLRVLHLDLPKFPKTSAVAEFLEVSKPE